MPAYCNSSNFTAAERTNLPKNQAESRREGTVVGNILLCSISRMNYSITTGSSSADILKSITFDKITAAAVHLHPTYGITYGITNSFQGG